MSREQLSLAAEHLSDAAEDAPESITDRIETQADQLAALAEREQGPDHGRLARHMTELSELEDLTDDPAIGAAYEAVKSYREGVSGV